MKGIYFKQNKTFVGSHFLLFGMTND